MEWAAAVASSALSYAVYYSTTASDVGTLAAITATGSAAILGGSIKGGTSLALTELAAATTYNVNIVVSDEAGNQAIYLVGTVTTLPAPETQPPAPAPDAAVLSSNTQTQATPQAPASQIYMYSFQQGVTGNMGGRNGADALCVENKPAVCSKTSNIHAYLNVSSSDYISVDNFATAASEQPPSTGAIVTPDGKTQIAKSWSNLLTQGGCQSDNSTCYQKTTKASIGWIEGIFLWIGASTDQNCSGWTTDSSNATAGFTGFQSYMNRLYTAIGSTACNKSIHLLCICW